jgi:tryptophan-rich sensory protein
MESARRDGRARAAFDIRFVIALAAPLAVGLLSGLATAGGVRDWYPTLAKPSFNPPDWLFGPVWTVLYLLMGVAAWLVWRRADEARVGTPLLLFAAQLLLNGLWSVLFFGLRSPGVAAVEILVLWLLIGLTIRAFRRVSVPAAVLLTPYWAWVTFAAALNLAIWMMNR